MFSPTKTTSGVLPDKSMIEKYKAIVAKCLTSNREYMIDIVRSTDYLELESTLYSGNQICLFSTKDGSQVRRDYAMLAVEVIAIIGEYDYILKF